MNTPTIGASMMPISSLKSLDHAPIDMINPLNERTTISLPKYLIAGLFAVVLMLVIACGGNDDAQNSVDQTPPESISQPEDKPALIASSRSFGGLVINSMVTVTKPMTASTMKAGL